MVEVGGWEHECCGQPYERDAVVALTCLDLYGPELSSTRYVESHHDLGGRQRVVTLRGRVVDLHLQHADGTLEAVQRLPGGSALRGVDVDDDGHLERPWTGEPVTRDSDRYLVTLRT